MKEIAKVSDSVTDNIEGLEDDDFEKVRQMYETEALKLNKLESFILKIVLPFVRIAHCRRSPYLMVKGNLILISSDIQHSMDKILPQPQQIQPVSFKRKLTYKGNFLEEWIDKEKVKKYFEFFKDHNPLFKDVQLSEERIKQFERKTKKDSKHFEECTTEQQLHSNEPKQNDCEENKNEEIKDPEDEIYYSDDSDEEEEAATFVK